MMVYLSSKHIAVKKNQDRTTFESNKIILCDGIGEFPDSDKAAEITIENLSFVHKKSEIVGMINQSASQIVRNEIIGGTTLIMAVIDEVENEILLRLIYLGNGSILHLHGNYFELPDSYGELNQPDRFSNLLIPHIDKGGVLLRHISHHSTPQELIPSTIELSLSGIHGDIILMFSDGINSLEDNVIIKDDQGRVWRNESDIVSIILNDLHVFLEKECVDFTQEKMNNFLENELKSLKDSKKFEDDASIGLIITDGVLNYYKQR